jgi:hypothetical protein
MTTCSPVSALVRLGPRPVSKVVAPPTASMTKGRETISIVKKRDEERGKEEKGVRTVVGELGVETQSRGHVRCIDGSVAPGTGRVALRTRQRASQHGFQDPFDDEGPTHLRRRGSSTGELIAAVAVVAQAIAKDDDLAKVGPETVGQRAKGKVRARRDGLGVGQVGRGVGDDRDGRLLGGFLTGLDGTEPDGGSRGEGCEEERGEGEGEHLWQEGRSLVRRKGAVKPKTSCGGGCPGDDVLRWAR